MFWSSREEVIGIIFLLDCRKPLIIVTDKWPARDPGLFHHEIHTRPPRWKRDAGLPVLLHQSTISLPIGRIGINTYDYFQRTLPRENCTPFPRSSVDALWRSVDRIKMHRGMQTWQNSSIHAPHVALLLHRSSPKIVRPPIPPQAGGITRQTYPHHRKWRGADGQVRSGWPDRPHRFGWFGLFVSPGTTPNDATRLLRWRCSETSERADRIRNAIHTHGGPYGVRHI